MQRSTFHATCCHELKQVLYCVASEVALDPSLFAPPLCHEAVAKRLTEQSGATFSRASVPEEEAGVTEADTAVRTAEFVLALG